MESFSERITKLENKIGILVGLLKKSNEEIDLIKNREITKIKDELDSCQKERNDIQQDLDNKMVELEVSNLSNDEKSKQIIELVNGEAKSLNSACYRLTNSWIDYVKLQDKMMTLLENKEQESKKEVDKMSKNNLFLIILIIFVLFYLLKKRKKVL